MKHDLKSFREIVLEGANTNGDGYYPANVRLAVSKKTIEKDKLEKKIRKTLEIISKVEQKILKGPVGYAYEKLILKRDEYQLTLDNLKRQLKDTI